MNERPIDSSQGVAFQQPVALRPFTNNSGARIDGEHFPPAYLLFNPGDEIPRVKGFGDKILHAGLECGNLAFDSRFAGQHDDGYPACIEIRLEIGDRGWTIHYRHHPVEHNGVGRILSNRTARQFSILVCMDGKARPGKNSRKQRARCIVILGENDRPARLRFSRHSLVLGWWYSI